MIREASHEERQHTVNQMFEILSTGQPSQERIPGGDLQTVTVRMPRDLHRSLIEAAYIQRTSLNRLCVAALREAAAEIHREPDRERTSEILAGSALNEVA